jgi:hypothetical protein
MELLEDTSLVLFRNARSCIGHADVEVAVDRLGSYTHLTGVGELARGSSADISAT